MKTLGDDASIVSYSQRGLMWCICHNADCKLHLKCVQLITCQVYLDKAIKNINGLHILGILAELLFSSSDINYTLVKVL